MKKETKRRTSAFIINLVIATLVFLPNMLQHHGLLMMTNDFNYQTTVFGMAINDAIKSGSGLWTPIADLGSDLLSLYSWNNIASPFYVWTLLFPAEWFSYLIGIDYILKFAFAGFLAYLYIAYFLEESKRNWAIIGGILYAFSGFQNVNMIFQFHDAVAFFPLILLALEKKADGFRHEGDCSSCAGENDIMADCSWRAGENDIMADCSRRVGENDIKADCSRRAGDHDRSALYRFGFLAISVAAVAVTNYFIFVEVVIFLLIYYVIRILCSKRVREVIRFTLSVFVEGLIGVMISAVILLPAFAGILQNSRSGERMWGGLLKSSREYLRLACALLLPAEPMTAMSYIEKTEFSSFSAFVPFVGLALVLCFVLKTFQHWKDKEVSENHRWIVAILGILVLGMAVPFLNNGFSLWTTTYQRWLFIPVLFFSLCSAMVLADVREYKVALSCLIMIISVVLLTLFLIVWDKVRVETVFNYHSLLVSCGAVLAGYVMLLVCVTLFKEEKTLFYSLLICAGACSVFFSSRMIRDYQNCSNESGEVFYGKMMACRQIDAPGGYRIKTDSEEDFNLAWAAKLPGRKTFSSTVSGKAMQFYESMGLERKVFTPEGPEGTNELLSVGYLLSPKIRDDLECVDTGTYEDITYYLYELEDKLPMGIVYTEYLTGSEYDSVDKELKSLAMLQYLIIPDDREDLVQNVLHHGDVDLVGKYSVSELVTKRKEAAEYFSNSYSGATVKCDSDCCIFFSIPNDLGWKATVNGEPVEIMECNGLIAVPLSGGTNEVELTYIPVIDIVGGLISVLGIILLVFGKPRGRSFRLF